MDPFVLLVVQTARRDVLRYVVVECGVQSVMISGMTLMLVLYVNSWDMILVRKDYRLHCDYANIGTAFGSAYFGEGTGSIVMDNAHCNGTESHLKNCTHITQHNCNHNEDAGVKCVCKYRLFACFYCIVAAGYIPFFCCMFS